MWNPFKREEKRAILDWPGWDRGDDFIPAASVERALSLVPVFGAARLLADTVASLTPVLYRMDGDVKKKLPTPSLFANPSIHGTLYDWLFRGTTSMALQGDAIGYITQRDFYGLPTMIEWLHPEQVTVQDGTLAGQGSYMNPIWWWNGRRMNPNDIVHIPWFCTPYKVRGLSPIGAYRATVNVGLGAQEFSQEWFNHGGVPPGTFKNSQQKVSKDEAELLTARITKRLRTRQPLVFGNDWEYTPIAIKPNEAQFIETARLTATHVAVIYGIPPEKIGGTTGSTLTYATVESNTLDYLIFSARPWLVRWEQALNRLFPRGQFVKFETKEMLRTDAKTRAEVDAISLANAPYKRTDEVRADRDLPPDSKLMELQANPAPAAPAAPAVPPKAQTNGKAPVRNGADAIVSLRDRWTPQSQLQPERPPILKPTPAANGTKPLAVGSN